MPRELCKQEVLTLGVCSWGSCVSSGFACDGHEKVWNKRKTSTSLHWTISHPWKVWKRSIQDGVATVVGRSSRYLPRITAKEVFEDARECCITGCGSTLD
jgi:hypothetical protein